MSEGASEALRLIQPTFLGPACRVRCFVTERTGGVSRGPFRTLNLAYHVGDQPRYVAENRARASAVAGIDPADWVVGQQVHGARVVTVTAADRGRGAANHGEAVAGADGLVTDTLGMPLVVLVADCAPVLLFDPSRAAVGLAHAGWRGTAAHVASVAVQTMRQAFDTDPGDLRALIGPSVGPDDYAVGTDVVAFFQQAYPEEWSRLLRFGPDAAVHLDIWGANALDLMAAGVAEERIHVMGLSTAAHSDRFYSHRAEGVTGRFAACIWLPAPQT